MAAYVLAALWLVGNLICLYLVKKRGLKPGLILRVIGMLLGPLAIPLVFILKP